MPQIGQDHTVEATAPPTWATPVSIGTTTVHPVDLVVVNQGSDWPGWIGVVIAVITLIVTGYIAWIAFKLQRDAHDAAQRWRAEDQDQMRKWREEDNVQSRTWHEEDLQLQREQWDAEQDEQIKRSIPNITAVLAFKPPTGMMHTGGWITGTVTNQGHVEVQLDTIVLWGDADIRLNSSRIDTSETLPVAFPPTKSMTASWSGNNVNRSLYDRDIKTSRLWIVCTDSLGREYQSEEISYSIPEDWTPRQTQ